jgi:hypothetical protein
MRRDIMSKKKYTIILGIISFLAIAFMISFNWGMKKFGSAHNQESKQNNEFASNTDRYASSNINVDNTILSNSKITIKIEYAKSGDTDTKTAEPSAFAGKSKSQLESEGYIVENMSQSQVTLYKKIDSYAPNKYVLGVKDECLAIYRTDANGTMYIENENTDVTDIKVPSKGDYTVLMKGSKHFQFNSREEAEAKLGEYDS